MRLIKIDVTDDDNTKFSFEEFSDKEFDECFEESNQEREQVHSVTSRSRRRRRAHDGSSAQAQQRHHEIPDFVTLSHTGINGENNVSYPEFRHQLQSDRMKPGRQALELCARQALSQKVNYIWFDAFCVDQSVLDEVNYAIRNRFRIHRASRFCCVVLEDYSLPDTVTNEGISAKQSEHSPSIFPFPDPFVDHNNNHNPIYFQQESPNYTEAQILEIEHLKQSQWFTSCLMLQELIAPKAVRFFDVTGRYVGDKFTMCHIIARITELPLRVITNPYLQLYKGGQYSIETRWKWIEKLNVAREEDRAYSMPGIVANHISFEYRDGKEMVDMIKSSILLKRVLSSWRTKDINPSLSLRLPAITADIASSVNKRVQDCRENKIAIFHPNPEAASALALTVLAAHRYTSRVIHQPWGLVSTCHLGEERGAQQSTYVDILTALISNFAPSPDLALSAIKEEYVDDYGYIKRSKIASQSDFLEDVLIFALKHLRSMPRRVVIVTDLVGLLPETKSRLESFMEEATKDNGVKWITTITDTDHDRQGFEYWESINPTAYSAQHDIHRWTKRASKNSDRDSEKDQIMRQFVRSIEDRVFVKLFAARLGPSLSMEFFPDNSEYCRVLLDRALNRFLEKIVDELDLNERDNIYQSLLHCKASHIIYNIHFNIHNCQKQTTDAPAFRTWIKPWLWSLYDRYINSITNTTSFRWLRWRIETYMELDYSIIDGDHFKIDDVVRRTLVPRREIAASNKVFPASQFFNVQFKTDWKIRDFHKSQGYGCSLAEMAEKAVVLTSGEDFIQATNHM